MTTTSEFHRRAMELFDSALLARQRGDDARSRALLVEALVLEGSAADSVVEDYPLEPTRSVLHRSAASIALQIGDATTARRYLEAALTGNPPLEMLKELRELDDQIMRLERKSRISSRISGRRRSPDRTPTKMIIDRFKQNLPVNIVGLAEGLGIHVQETALGPAFAGEIYRDPDSTSGYSVRVNASDPEVRKRFTVGHEIGHYLLHRDRFTDRLRDDNMYRSGLGDQLEQAANRLAADLLMPAKAIRDLRAQGISSPEEMAIKFGVSLQAMQLRLGLRDRKRKPSKADLITIEYRNPANGHEGSLLAYLEEKLQVRLSVELVESVDWPITTLFLAPVAVPLTIYAGKKLIDVLVDLLRAWLQERPQIPEIVLYDADGKIIKKVSRK